MLKMLSNIGEISVQIVLSIDLFQLAIGFGDIAITNSISLIDSNMYVMFKFLEGDLSFGISTTLRVAVDSCMIFR